MAPTDSVPIRQTGYPAFTVRDLLTAVFFHRRAMIIAFVVPAVLGLLAAFGTKTSYVAEARLLVLLGSEYIYRPEVGEAGSGIALDRNQFIQAEIEILSSEILRADTLAAIGLKKVYPDQKMADEKGGDASVLSAAADRMKRDVIISSVPQSNVLELSFRHADPTIAAEVLNKLIELYLERRREVFQKTISSAAANQGEQFAARLRKAEVDLTDFTAAHGITNFDEQVTLLLRQQADLAADQRQAEQRRSAITAQIEALRRQATAVPENIPLYAENGRSQQVDGLTLRLIELENQRRQLVGKYQDDFPLVRELDAQIVAVRSALAGSPPRQSMLERSGRNPTYQEITTERLSLQTEFDGLQARRLRLTTDAAAVQARLDELNRLGLQLRDMQRNRGVLEETYRTFSLKAAEARLADDLERGRVANVRIVQPAVPPQNGSSPGMIIAVAGFVLGGLAAFVTVVLLTTLQQVFVTIRDAETHLDLPVVLAVALGGNQRRRPPMVAREPAPAEPAGPALQGV